MNRSHRYDAHRDTDDNLPRLGTPGKRTLTQQLQRRADANGVRPDAEAAVDRAASSSGAPLPDDLRTRFEGSLGADLSAVRVHTGSESAEASKAVGAKAYATGQDIHFGAGHYDPSSAFGVHLIAHEVAHTVQQGSAPTRQHKLEVSAPQDGAEIEADRAADAMVAGASASVGPASGVARRSEGGDGSDIGNTGTAPPYAAGREGAVLPGEWATYVLKNPNVFSSAALAEGLHVTSPMTSAIQGSGAFYEHWPKLAGKVTDFANDTNWNVPSSAKSLALQVEKNSWSVVATPTLRGCHYTGPAEQLNVASSQSSSTSTQSSTGSGTTNEVGMSNDNTTVKAGAQQSSGTAATAGSAGVVSAGTQREGLRFSGLLHFEIAITMQGPGAGCAAGAAEDYHAAFDVPIVFSIPKTECNKVNAPKPSSVEAEEQMKADGPWGKPDPVCVPSGPPSTVAWDPARCEYPASSATEMGTGAPDFDP